MAHIDFLSPISVIPGFGEKRLEAFRESGIIRVEDLLYHFPRKYLDKTKSITLSEAEAFLGEFCLVSGVITSLRLVKGSRLHITISDNIATLDLLWFSGVSYVEKLLSVGQTISAYGEIKKFHQCQMVHPELTLNEDGSQYPFEPRYPLTGAMRKVKIGQKRILQAVEWLFKNLRHCKESLPKELEEKYGFPSLRDVLHAIHFPQEVQTLEIWFRRIQYEELYQLALHLRWMQKDYRLPGRKMEGTFLQEAFIKRLPFTLTIEQLQVVDELAADSNSAKRMHRLLQGDVGSGKTVTAFIATLPALQSGYQVAWLAPTTVLAKQSFRQIKEWLASLDFTVELLTGSTSPKESREIIRGLTLGTIHFVVGTHAILQDRVAFASLGMVVVDEQHRFGAEQRLILQKRERACDLLMMSATPIPQSLAATLYSDLDLTTIKTLPAGRKEIKTHLVAEEKRAGMEQFIFDRIKHGEQAYWIVPRIESTKESCNELSDIEARYKQLCSGLFQNVAVGVLHGQMKEVEKQSIMELFSEGKLQLLIATTVVEVGVNVPNATVIVIENSERFGLAQLHQLRGRVGRGSLQSWAFLLGGATMQKNAIDRLLQFCAAKDGFEIAELDLVSRGAGEVTGFRQSGFSELRFSDILEHADLFQEIQKDIDRLLLPS